MPRSVYHAPFHRRILPWVFGIIFIVAAPTLIFYTSGYRFNPKKNTIERNGTLIVDSEPSGATIEIDGQKVAQHSPSTFQNMPPGPHTLRLSLNGYYPWQKQLEVRQEQVTFANDIRLWRYSQPQLFKTTIADKIEASDDGDMLAAHDAVSNTIEFIQPSGATVASITLPHDLATGTAPLLRWNQSNNAVLVNGQENNDVAILVNADRKSPAELLPSGRYYWNGDTLMGSNATRSYTLNSIQQSLESDLLTNDNRGSLDGLYLQYNTSTDSLLIRSGLILHQLYALPAGQWQFAAKAKPYQLLKQGESSWLAVRIRATGNDSARITGDEPRWLASAAEPTAIFLNRNELWIWELDKDPQLISRQSQPYVQAVWYKDGTSLFATDGREVYALELDDRDGRMKTPLANFDQVYDIAYADGSLFVAAKSGEQRGIWKIVLE